MRARVIPMLTLLLVACGIMAGVAAATTFIEAFAVEEPGALSRDRQTATFTGTITCSAGPNATWSVYVSVGQVVGRIQKASFGSSNGPCTGATQTWSVTTQPLLGELRFSPGKANGMVQAYYQDDITSEDLWINKVVRLK